MSDDDLSQALLEGDAYERASVLTRRVFPVSLTRKVRVCILTSLAASALAPAVWLRREFIRDLEGADPVAGTPPAFVVVAGVGVALSFLFGLVLVALGRAAAGGDLDFERAKRLVRTEDVVMTFVVSTGVLFVAAPLVLALVGVALPGSVVWLYEQDVHVYQTAGRVAVDTWVVSGAGLALAAVLFAVDAAVGAELPAADG